MPPGSCQQLRRERRHSPTGPHLSTEALWVERRQPNFRRRAREQLRDQAAGARRTAQTDVAMAEGATVLVVINPMVPMQFNDAPPSTRGDAPRARGMPWIVNQAIRIGATRGIREQCRRAEASGAASVLLIEPEADQSVMFVGNPSSPESRRRVLEYAYKRTRAVIASSEEALSRAGLLLRPPRTEPPRSRV